jgi:hypothetical protein
MTLFAETETVRQRPSRRFLSAVATVSIAQGIGAIASGSLHIAAIGNLAAAGILMHTSVHVLVSTPTKGLYAWMG